MTFRSILIAVVALITAVPASAQVVQFLEVDGDVWQREQLVVGWVEGAGPGEIVVGDRTYPMVLDHGNFETAITLDEGLNAVIARAFVGDGTGEIVTDTLRLNLPFTLRPEGELIPTVEGRTVTLDGSVLANPDGSALQFEWTVDADNPTTVTIEASSDSLATASIPESADYGTYYFNWTITEADGDSFRARTFVVVDSTGIDPFEIETEHAPWVDRAILYEIMPRAFTFNGNLRHIINRIPELVELGVNTLWIQPIFDSTHDQGYAVLDYFTIRRSFGTEADVHELVEKAHAAGLRVMFDFVPNHSDIRHRYAQDAIENGVASQYYDFYMRKRDGAPYSQHYNTSQVGEMSFVYYFWDDLVNFNYNDPGVQRFIIEASRYWIEEFDIDGYRFDAVWAPAARNPEFMHEWRRALKRVKPEIMMLAEDKARVPSGYFDPYDAFDVAYDWSSDPDWISKWQFQLSSEETTVFNTTDSRRTMAIRSAIGENTGEPILRYIENNDSPRFIANHSLAMTRLASTLMYTLPGVPMLYNGQEVGHPVHPYELGSGRFIFGASTPIKEQQETSLFPHYQSLNWIKSNLEPLHTLTYEEVDTGDPRYLFAFRRWTADQHVLTVMNPQEVRRFGTLALPVDEMGLEEGQTYYLTNLFTGESEAYTRDELAALSIAVNPETAIVYALGSEVVQVPTSVEPAPGELPETMLTVQNYPNPFADRTTLEFTLPVSGEARVSVYDVLGREVLAPLKEHLAAGKHTLDLDASRLATGTYFVRIDQGDRSAVRMITQVR